MPINLDFRVFRDFPRSGCRPREFGPPKMCLRSVIFRDFLPKLGTKNRFFREISDFPGSAKISDFPSIFEISVKYRVCRGLPVWQPNRRDSQIWRGSSWDLRSGEDLARIRDLAANPGIQLEPENPAADPKIQLET